MHQPKQEIERKILNVDRDQVVQKMQEMGAKLSFSGLMRVRYFDTGDYRFKSSHELLRVRECIPSDGAIFTEVVLKTNMRLEKNCKVYDENEFVVKGENAFEEVTVFLCAMGFSVTMHYEKRRAEYRHQGVKFELDEYPKIPVLLEIEAGSPEKIEEAIAMMELGGHEQSAESVTALFESHYKDTELNGLAFNGK